MHRSFGADASRIQNRDSSAPAHFRDHNFFAPNRARRNTEVNADPTIVTALTTTNVRAVSAGEVIQSPFLA
jgi:hypothetical protein